MFRETLGKEQLQAIVASMSNVDIARLLYCQEMAGVYIAVGRFENMLISAMHMCDRVKVQKVLGPDQSLWARAVAKKGSAGGIDSRLADQNPRAT